MAALACVLAFSGAALADTHDEGDGRLSARSGSGGFIAAAPVHRAYWVSFGEWVLCDTALDEGAVDDTIEITGVRYLIGKYEPLEVRAYLRTVTPHQVASHPHKPVGSYSPFIANRGRPAHFDQAYSDPDWKPLGHYTRDVAGTSVRRGCDQAVADANADYQGEVPQHAWTSIVLAVKVGRHAGRVRRTLVDYTTGDVEHTLRIRWVVGGQGYGHHH